MKKIMAGFVFLGFFGSSVVFADAKILRKPDSVREPNKVSTIATNGAKAVQVTAFRFEQFNAEQVGEPVLTIRGEDIASTCAIPASVAKKVGLSLGEIANMIPAGRIRIQCNDLDKGSYLPKSIDVAFGAGGL